MGPAAVTAPGPLARLERAAIGATPVIALAIVALGLRIGAGTRDRGALVYARGPGHGRGGLAWQIVLVAEEGGVREVLPEASFDVAASVRGEHATWHGVTNADGVAEAWLDLPGAAWGDPVALKATAEDGEVLGEGAVKWPEAPHAAPAAEGKLTATRTTGPLGIEVFVRAGKLVPGSPESVFVRVVDAATRKGREDVALTFVPEPGVSVARAEARTSKDGWAEVRVTAEFLVAGWTVDAKTGSEAGSWYGALPVAPGAASVELPAVLPPAHAYPLALVVPPATRRLYVEVDDAWGCDFASAVDVPSTSSSGSVGVTLPGLPAGAYWLVTSSDARGAEALTGSTLARPFEVTDDNAPSGRDVRRAAAPFARFLALDGLVRPHARAAARRRRGVWIALGALLAAAGLEVLLLLRAAARARGRLARLSEATEDAGGDGPGLEPDAAGGIAVLVLATVLGFVLIAALMMVRDS
jgi:hypothetical protein